MPSNHSIHFHFTPNSNLSSSRSALQVVREHYLRDDIYSGSPLDPACPQEHHKLSLSASTYLVIDTNIVLHQIDLLEHASVTNIIVPSVVLEEVRARNKSVYDRLRNIIDQSNKSDNNNNNNKVFYVFANEHHRETYVKGEQGESPNNRNDRAIRMVASWYTARIPADQCKVCLLTDDADCRRKAVEHGIVAISAAEYAATQAATVPELQDLVAGNGCGGGTGGLNDVDISMDCSNSASKRRKNSNTNKRSKFYEDHRPMSDITAGIKGGRYHQGSLRVSRFNSSEGWVGSESVGQDILISGREAMNRAMDGDIVAIELLPHDQWRAPASALPSSNKKKKKTKGGRDGMEVDNEDNEDNEEEEEEDDVSMLDEEEGAHLAAQVDPGEHYDDDGTATTITTAAVGGLKPTGKVVGIIKRNWRSRGYCGSLAPPKSGRNRPLSDASTSYVLFLPVERKYPAIKIQTRQAATLSDKRFVVAIDNWEADSIHPMGHYVRTLGHIGDKEVETEVLLIENDINTSPFTPAVHACVPPLPWSVTPTDLTADSSGCNRTDLRHLAVCSVDPPGCKDIDDALHIRQLPGSDNLEVGVHIADVTHFLHPGTAMDEEAARRATTVYLVQRRIDMLPKPLTEDICSLRAGVDRLAFSVIWELTPEGNIVKVHFTKSVIRSRAAMTYAEAQSRIDDPRLTDELSVNLRLMNGLAKKLRRRRIDAGALQLASPEVKFEIDTETHNPLDVGMYQVRETNQMVEEMMLLANCTVAEHTLRAFPSCALLRRHPTPPPRQFEPLLRAAAAVGVSLNISSSKALADSLDAAVRATDPYFNKLIRIMATRCMTQAVYISAGEYSEPEYHHYGLAASLYTHFTSPIRRYADVMAHRVLMAALGLKPLPQSMQDRDGTRGVVDNLNVRHHNAQMAGRASVELHTVVFFKGKVTVADARVTRVRCNGLIVFVPKYGIEGPVFLDDGKDDGTAGTDNNNNKSVYIYDEERQRVESQDGSVCFTIFDPCAVSIEVEEGVGGRRSLSLKLVDRSMVSEEEMVKL